MPQFQCSVCETEFSIPKAALDKYPGWKPKYCREHSPSAKGATKAAKTGVARTGTAKKASAKAKPSVTRRRSGAAEENLTLEQVLVKYSDGPSSGVFTDGSSSPNPGPGGWGMVWVEDGQIRGQDHGHEAQTTNNRMELAALIAAYRLLPAEAETTVYTDSRLCVDTITKWAPGWEKNGWKRKGSPLKNLDLVRELLRLYRSRPLAKLQWIAAHSGYRWNEYADSLATAWMRAIL